MRVSSDDTSMLIINVVRIYVCKTFYTMTYVYNFLIIPSDQINISNGNIKKYIYIKNIKNSTYY